MKNKDSEKPKLTKKEIEKFKSFLEITHDGMGNVVNIKCDPFGTNRQFETFKKEEFVKFFKNEICHFEKDNFRTDLFNFCFSNTFHNNKDKIFFINDKYACNNEYNVICLNHLSVDEMTRFLSSMFKEGYVLRFL